MLIGDTHLHKIFAHVQSWNIFKLHCKPNLTFFSSLRASPRNDLFTEKNENVHFFVVVLNKLNSKTHTICRGIHLVE